MKRRHGQEGGFSLLEAVLAVLILGVGITGMVEGITAALRTSRDAERRTAAALLASGRLEEIRAEGTLIEGESEVEPEGGLDDAGPEAEVAGAPPRETPDGGTPPREETSALYSIHESIARTPADGLYEVVVTVRLAATGEALHEARTLLFEAGVTLRP